MKTREKMLHLISGTTLLRLGLLAGLMIPMIAHLNGCSFSDSRNEVVAGKVGTTAIGGKVNFPDSQDLKDLKMGPDTIITSLSIRSPQLPVPMNITTDGSGRFRTENLPGGEYLLSFTSGTRRLGDISLIAYPEEITCCLASFRGNDGRDLDRDGITDEMTLTAEVFTDNNEDLFSDGNYIRTITSSGTSITLFSDGKSVYNDGRGTTTIRKSGNPDEIFADRDGDEIPDNLDDDDDNDGIRDMDDFDLNNNGIADNLEETVPEKFPPVVTLFTIRGTSGDISVLFATTDKDSENYGLVIEYRGGTTGSLWMPANVSGDRINLEPGDQARTFVWHSALDQPHMRDSNYQFRVTPVGVDNHQGNPVLSKVFSVDNIEVNTPPLVSITRPGATTVMTGVDLITWSASDIDPNDLIQRIWLHYSLNDGDWSRITIIEGNPGYYDWDTRALPNSTRYRLKIDAFDGEDITSVVSRDYFSVSNTGKNMYPTITNITALGNSDDIAITYDLSDTDGDICSIKVDYRSTLTGSSWVPATVGGTQALIAPGTGKNIVWRSKLDEPLADSRYFQVRITPQDPSTWGAGGESAPLLIDNVP